MKIPSPRPPSSRRVERNGSPSQSSTSAGNPGPSSSITRIEPGPRRPQRDHAPRCGRTGSRCRSGWPANAAAPASAPRSAPRVSSTGSSRTATVDPGPGELGRDMLEQAVNGARVKLWWPSSSAALAQAGEQLAAALAWVSSSRRLLGQRAAVGSSRTSSLAMMLIVASGRAEQMRHRCRLPAQRRQLLLAGQRQLGRGQRLGPLPRLLGHAPGEHGDQHRAEAQRRPAARRR